ncbi:hypothetical protein MJO29_006211, partial [Puccinia striiformis f. sp. tritici]
ERRKTNTSDSSSIQHPPRNNPWTNSYQDHRAPVVDSSSTYIQSTHSTGSSLTQDHSSRPITTTTTRNYPLNAELYETRLGSRVDLLAALVYCTPFMGLIILIFETKNDYIRIHGYQSLLIAIPLGLLHLIFISIQFIQTLLFLVDLGIYTCLAYRAYCSAEILDLNLLPVLKDGQKKNKKLDQDKICSDSSLLESINLSYTQSIYTESFNLIYLKINGTQLNYYHHVTECIYSKSIISINHSQSDNVSST